MSRPSFGINEKEKIEFWKCCFKQEQFNLTSIHLFIYVLFSSTRPHENKNRKGQIKQSANNLSDYLQSDKINDLYNNWMCIFVSEIANYLNEAFVKVKNGLAVDRFQNQ